MSRLTIGHILNMLDQPYITIGRSSDDIITGVSTDTRTLAAGNLFVPLIGENYDGHQFVTDAIQAGAVASLWQRNVPNPPADVPLIIVDNSLEALQQLAKKYLQQHPAKVIGITGSNGKTTTKDLIASVLQTSYKVHKTIGNYNNHIGLPLTILAMEPSTEVIILEMGMSDLGEIQLLSEIAEPDISIITNVGEAHLLQLQTRENIARAKFEITEGLKRDGKLVVTGKEPLFIPLLEQYKLQAPEVQIVTIGDANAQSSALVPHILKRSEQGSQFVLRDGSEFFIPLLGDHNVFNSLFAIEVGRNFGLSNEQIQTGFYAFSSSGMRLELTRNMQRDITVINDAYNSSPSALIAALELLHNLQHEGRKIAIIGDMLELGEEEEKLHRHIAKHLDFTKIDLLYTVGSRACWIADEARKFGYEQQVKNYDRIEDLLNGELTSQFQPGDLYLVKASRGIKLEQVVSALLDT